VGYDGSVKTVGIREAQTHFQQLAREVEQGEEVVITRRGRRVARMIPLEEGLPVEQPTASQHDE